ncbi:DNA repair protein RecN (Recombination protein N) [Deinobacterium chartae]|uniref:DNA repair protein RecN n=1 Tax=Deinobacterium chartae TaxID=521158 RepID=A0A841I1W4_9DEIO|nr:DNA repair protein RecN (Recombination protein N) [Deinobacterium chartae]
MTTLTRLEVEHLAIIDRLELDLHPGFSVFTGETGAGKSILVDALSLLLGGRASADMVRSGEDSLLVTGWWDEESASRRVTAQGRGNARIDGEVVSLRELGARVGERLTIHGQHAAQALLNPRQHREYLDGTLGGEPAAYRATFERWRAARERLRHLQESERDRARQLDLLEYQWQEIEAVRPRPGEDAPLQEELRRLSNLEAIASGATSALELLSEADVSAESLIGEAIRALSGSARFDRASSELLGELKELQSSLQAIAGELRGISEESAPDPQALAETEARLSQLARLQSKYGPGLEDVLAYQRALTEQLEQLRRDEADLQGLEDELRALTGELQQAGEALSRARTQAAGPLAERLVAVVRQLGMPQARLEFTLRALPEPGPYGLEEVEISFSANPGEPLGALSSIASGGELSRVMLALSTVLGAETDTVIFDEVDAGIGGAAALAVAEQLAGLSASRQVMVVTHLAQIAARADHHYLVEKRVTEAGRTETAVRLLQGEERLLELARLLSGSASAAALEHARELLAR